MTTGPYEYIEIDTTAYDNTERCQALRDNGWEEVTPFAEPVTVFKRQIAMMREWTYDTCQNGYVIYKPGGGIVKPYDLVDILNEKMGNTEDEDKKCDTEEYTVFSKLTKEESERLQFLKEHGWEEVTTIDDDKRVFKRFVNQDSRRKNE